MNTRASIDEDYLRGELLNRGFNTSSINYLEYTGRRGGSIGVDFIGSRVKMNMVCKGGIKEGWQTREIYSAEEAITIIDAWIKNL